MKPDEAKVHWMDPDKFKCAAPRSDTPGVMRCDLLLGLFVLCLVVGANTVCATPPLRHPTTWRSLEGPRVGVADAAAIELDGGDLILVGGFTARLESTAAVQRRSARHGWEPVGTSLLTPRASPLIAALPDRRLLVVGGWTGTLPSDVQQLGDAELCDPRRPERRRALTSPFPDREHEGLEGATMCTLHDGRILLVHDRDIAVFDPSRMDWTRRIRLGHARRGATLIALPDDDVVVVGGGDDGTPPIVTIHIDENGDATSEPWKSSLASDLRHASGIVLNSREALVVGGESRGSSTTQGWVLDLRERTVRDIAPLPIPGGIARATLVRIDDRVLVLGGETVEHRFPTAPANGAVLRPPWDRPLVLDGPPVEVVRSMSFPAARGGTVLGGYRFDPTAARDRRIQVHRDAFELVLPVFAIVD